MSQVRTAVLVGMDLKVTTVEKVSHTRGRSKWYRYTCTCGQRGKWHGNSAPAEAVATVHAVLHHDAQVDRGKGW